ncbi:hypothetical protein BGZ81_009965, partial [Podila clonocystis]
MIKHGYSTGIYEIPPLDTFKVLWNCDPNIVGCCLPDKTLEALVNNTITYLQELTFPKARYQAVTPGQLALIKTFLNVQEDDSGEGNLSRYITPDQTVLWMCQSHIYQRLDQGTLESLVAFTLSHGGQVDMHHSTLRVGLGSPVEADQFMTFLAGVSHVFDISLKLHWKATRSYVKTLCLDIANTGTVTLEIDGISLDINPQGHEQYLRNIFSDVIIFETQLQFVTLLNYPQPQQQCIHFQQFCLQSALPTECLDLRWVNLREDLGKFRDLVSTAQKASDCNRAAEELRSVLENHGLFNVTAVTLYIYGWDAVFDLKKGAFDEVYAHGTLCPRALLFSGALRKLTATLDHLQYDQEFFHMLQTNRSLQELNISYDGHNMLHYADNIVRMWHRSLSSSCLTLVDRRLDTK